MPTSDTHVLVYRAKDERDAALMVQQLEAEGLAVSTVGGAASYGFGELPSDAFEVELWVERAFEARARARLAAFDRERTASPRAPWTCACGEANDGGFDVCWSCQTARPEAAK